MKKSIGFTLIELLITITIIAVLSALGLIAYSSVLQQGRDSKRQSDLRSIQSALEQYMSDQGYYPALSPSPLRFGSGNALTSNTGNPSPRPSATPKTYLNSVPQDPLASPHPSYSYVPLPSGCTTNCINYCLYADLDNPPSPLPSPPTGCSYDSYDFVVSTP